LYAHFNESLLPMLNDGLFCNPSCLLDLRHSISGRPHP
jgi:hypothetical protein